MSGKRASRSAEDTSAVRRIRRGLGSQIARRSKVARVGALALLFIVGLSFGYVRQIQAPSALAADPQMPGSDDPRIALWHAADAIEARLSGSGAGFAFSATQIQVMRPTPGGPDLILGPDREHPDASPTAVDHIVLGALSGRGAATPTSFYAEWFNGTTDNGAPVYEGTRAYGALMRDGQIWRRDAGTDAQALGWIESSDLPGFGVDPFSLRVLPDLLRRLESPTDLGLDADGHHWSGTVEPLWYPGAVAVDGGPFTGNPVQVELWLDSQDQLTALFAVAQNINEPTYQLLCIDRVRFDYTSVVAVPTPDVTSPP